MIANFYLDLMKKVPKNVFDKVERLAKSVLTNLKNKGYVVPSKEKDGSIRFNQYIVFKETTGFYSVKDLSNRIYAENINLPQTAALIANDIALGRIVDNNLLALDRQYGYKLFDEELFRRNFRRKKNTIDEVIHYRTLMEDSAKKAKFIKETIDRSFLKLSRIA